MTKPPHLSSLGLMGRVRLALLLLAVFTLGVLFREGLGRLMVTVPSSPIPASATVAASPSPRATATVTPVPRATAVPARTATAVPTPTPRRPVEKVTKMGVGVYSRGGGHLIDALLRAQPTTILLMDPDPGFAREVRQWFPKAFIMGRRYVADQPLDNPEARGAAFADFVAELAVPLKGVVDAWMSYNEVVASSAPAEKIAAYNSFQVAFAQRLQDTYGIAAVASNDGTAAFAPEDYVRYFAPALRESRYFGIHAYAPKEARSLQEQAEWFALRYRKIHQALAAAGIPHGPMVLTETGLWNGWRGLVSEEDMSRGFAWLADELEKDDYVRGMAIYGILPDHQEWRAFDIYATGLLDLIGQYWPAGRPRP